MNFYKDGKSVLALLSGSAESVSEVTANTTDAAVEKHVPVYEVNDGKVCVTVGSVAHPMAENHYIQWIAVETNKGFYVKYLLPNEKPEACFTVDNEVIQTVYAYCNLHGLWEN
ncbi:MAG: desulfoferrodoxin Dfx [Ruminococcus sp.]|nr:desulfoferrodoxin Dfx [Ruminococcus sp.]